MSILYSGCAGWSLPKPLAEHFPATGSHLERYAARINAVEINSSFYRPHRHQTYSRWAASVPEAFRFAVKVPRSISHERRLQHADALLDTFLGEISGLGDKIGPLLVQLPPSFGFVPSTAYTFFSALRERCKTQVVCEPRHVSWFVAEANDLLAQFQVARAAVDPVPVPQVRMEAAHPGGWSGLKYYRLHGSPIIYRSAYPLDYIHKLAGNLQRNVSQDVPTWCIFDNTAEGAATHNALQLGHLLSAVERPVHTGFLT